ncbi:MAG: DUF1707 domain-containing protein [Actinomycetia bacterium]|nr:DUF1707 domain-containing protein [Actinomycetes bacterium]
MQPGPRDPRTIRASDADRQRIADVLAQAYADGRLTLAEHTDRVNALWSTKMIGELEPLIADLGTVATPAAAAAPTARLVAPVGQPLRVVQVFSSGSQNGDWLVPRQINDFVLFGSSTLDMRQAAFSELDVEVMVNALFGSIEVKVPAGVSVVDETMHLFGAVTMRGLGEAAPGAPVVRLKGFVMFGSVDVRGGDYQTFGQRLGFAR